VVTADSDCFAGDATPPNPFEIVSISSADAPRGTTGSDWHRYEISQGHNQIIGFRSGKIEHVTLEIEELVFRLNDRRRLKRGRVHVVFRPRSTIPAQ